MPLNPKQERFIAEYLLEANATQAATKAGYSKKTAYSQGQRLLNHVEVSAAIQKGKEKIHRKLDISADRIREELARIAFADMADYVTVGTEGEVSIKPFSEMPEGASRAVSKIKEVRRIMNSSEGDGKDLILEARVEYGHHDKLRALEMLGKDIGMFKERVEVDFPDEKPQIDEAERKVAERLKKIKGKK